MTPQEQIEAIGAAFAVGYALYVVGLALHVIRQTARRLVARHADRYRPRHRK